MAQLSVREYRSSDKEPLLALLRDSFAASRSDLTASRWDDGGARALFAWKHEDNPLGPSFGWVAEDGDRIVGYRVFMRYEFVHGGVPVKAVRAVDTATHAEYRGRGIFRLLTLHAIEELTERGVDFIFNTPNQLSMPGYLKMGWRQADQLHAYAFARSPLCLPRLATAFVPGGGWQEVDPGLPAAADVLGDGGRLQELLDDQSQRAGLAPRRSVDFLRWRYGRDPFGYSALTSPRDSAPGVAIFRLVERAGTRKVVLADVITPAGGTEADLGLVDDVLRRCRAHFAVRTGNRNQWGLRAVGQPRSACPVVFRPLHGDDLPAVESWGITLDDLEI